ncbi:BAG family molecular chaperone regulator 5, mitochondrial isoform X2 [Cryptomeria japonica]|uniref:BAG family molecular chaperone regulator 5, mitochondrial isoform X2 n=1 Tax=Cryptomeria japonica TaxID=3369 RepID=UPI0027D9D5C7|nr:BAG family molecular chaperone regulator 5, mitochondrial isoform X2 [Cryptomeria japonica]
MNNSVSRRDWDRNPQSMYRVPVSSSLSSSAVSIPVRFVNIDSPWAITAPPRHMDEIPAAVKIQSVFRGFYVRKTKTLEILKVIAGVKASMEEMRRHINDPHCLELMRQNEKERLKIAEGIMSLLLKLDEIQEVEFFVWEQEGL